jgi:hypothetical protein
MFLFAIQSNATSLIPKCKSSTTTTNLASFTRTTILPKKKKTYQNEFENKQIK